jgi:hypothetical protein
MNLSVRVDVSALSRIFSKWMNLHQGKKNLYSTLNKIKINDKRRKLKRERQKNKGSRKLNAI